MLQADNGVTATLSGSITQGSGTNTNGQTIAANQPVIFALTPGSPGNATATFVLSYAANSWSGVTTINGGVTVQGSDRVDLRAFRSPDNGVLDYVQAADATVSQNISGSGALVKDGAGRPDPLRRQHLCRHDHHHRRHARGARPPASSAPRSSTTARSPTTRRLPARWRKNISGSGAVTIAGLTGGNTLTFSGALTNAGGVILGTGGNIAVGATGSIVNATFNGSVQVNGTGDIVSVAQGGSVDYTGNDKPPRRGHPLHRRRHAQQTKALSSRPGRRAKASLSTRARRSTTAMRRTARRGSRRRRAPACC